ncbi:MAG: hypothetical protein K2N15_01685 [Lachnospiraceae bacterium]|nr:hypothetical protein [Lachnospiraceae bacterium]
MLKKFFNVKVALTLTIMCCTMWVSGMTVHAQNVNETESNNTVETAQLIQANSETPAQALTGNRPNQYFVEGHISASDEDWFKVYLTSGTQYVICNGNGFDFEVYNSDLQLVYEDSYLKSGNLGSSAFPFWASSNGFYYVRITGSSSQSYLLGVGGPTYSVEACKVNLRNVDMSGNRASTVAIDLRNRPEIPEGALVYAIRFSGIGATSVDSISVRNLTTANTINLQNFTWSKDGLLSLEMPLESNWQATFGYYKNTSFTPTATFQFVYPVTSHYIDAINITL